MPIDDGDDDREPTDVRKTLKQVERHIGALAEGQQMLTQLARTEERVLGAVGRVNDRISDLERSLHGERDGKTGLTARVTNLEANAAERAAELANKTAERIEEKRGRTALVVATVSAIAAVVAAAIAAAIALGHHP